jgi:hypothetical protein
VCVAAGPDLAGVVLDRPLVGGRARTFTTPAPEPIYCQAKRDLKLVGIDHFAFVACPAER